MRKFYVLLLCATVCAWMGATEGALKGAFKVGENSWVSFSKGNLQFNAASGTHATQSGTDADGTFQFASHQWDVCGANNANIAEDYDGWIDLFGWGTSGYNSKYPYMRDKDNTAYPHEADIAGTNADWGVYNAISNGGDAVGLWRTLTTAEWNYLLYTRDDAASKRAFALVNSVAGYVLLPDSWKLPSSCSFNADATDYSGNVYSGSQWTNMETQGAVFLPKGGYRNAGTDYVNNFTDYGCYYWTSTEGQYYSGYRGDVMEATAPEVGIDDMAVQCGAAVRLVQARTPLVGDIFIATSGVNRITYEVKSLSPKEVQVYRTGHELVENSTLTIPETVDYLGETFTVTTIADNPQFPNVSVVSIPKTVNATFSMWSPDFSNLASFVVDDENTVFSSYEGVLYNKAKTSLLRCPRKNTEFTDIPTTVKTMDYNAFANCEHIDEIHIPTGVTFIGAAFNNSSLRKIYIPATVTSLGNSTFANCSRLESVVFEDVSVLNVAWDSFSYCKLVNDVESGLVVHNGLAIAWKGAAPDTLRFPEGVVNVPYAFTNRMSSKGNLRCIVFPSTLRVIHGKWGSEDETSNKFPSLVKTVMRSTVQPTMFDSPIVDYSSGINPDTLLVPCGKLSDYTSNAAWKDSYDVIMEGIVYDVNLRQTRGGVLSMSTTANCGELEVTATPNSGWVLTAWSNGADASSTTQTLTPTEDMTLSATFMKVPAVNDTIRYTYKGNTLYYKITYIGSTFREVGVVNDGGWLNWNDAANQPTGAVVLPDQVEDWQGAKYNVTEMYSGVFRGCTNITSFDFTENTHVSTLGTFTFDGCTSMTEVKLSDYITNIYSYSFRGCALTSIDLKNVTFIDDGNFWSSNITAVHVPASLTNINDQAYLFHHALTITCDDANPKYRAVDNMLFNRDTTLLVSLPNGLTTGELRIPISVDSIAYRAMEECGATVIINSRMGMYDGNLVNGDDRNSPLGKVILGCGLLEHYTTGKYRDNFARATVTEQLLWDVSVTAGAHGGVELDTTSCNMVHMVATPDAHYDFVGWSNGLTDEDVTIEVTGDTALVATFAPHAYTITIVSDHGTVTAKDGDDNVVDLSSPVTYGTVLTLTATPDTDYRFDGWTNYDPATGLAVDEDVTITASYHRIGAGLDAVKADAERNNEVRKIYREGRILIVLPDGRVLNTLGVEVK